MTSKAHVCYSKPDCCQHIDSIFTSIHHLVKQRGARLLVFPSMYCCCTSIENTCNSPAAANPFADQCSFAVHTAVGAASIQSKPVTARLPSALALGVCSDVGGNALML